jgi:4-hydroxybenzoyl-CoA thioesterase
MSFTSTQKIRFDDVDGAGIVYYPRFFHMCHKAFEDFFDEKGPVGYPKLISEWRRGFPTVHTDGNYLAPLRYGDLAQVELTVEHVGNSSLKTRYHVVRVHDGALAFIGLVTTVCVELESFRPTPIDGDLRAFLLSHMAGRP